VVVVAFLALSFLGAAFFTSFSVASFLGAGLGAAGLDFLESLVVPEGPITCQPRS
jgi:hypothetical protein